MKGCWDPEFEPKTIDDILWRFSQIAFFGEFALGGGGGGVGGFPIHLHVGAHVEVMSKSTSSSRAPQFTCIQSMHGLWMHTVARCNTFHEGREMYM